MILLPLWVEPVIGKSFADDWCYTHCIWGQGGWRPVMTCFCATLARLFLRNGKYTRSPKIYISEVCLSAPLDFFILCTICFSKMLLLLPPLSSDKTIKIRNRTFCRSWLVPRLCAAVNWSCKKYIIQYVIWWILAIDYIIYHTINHTSQNYAAVHFPVSVLSVPVWIYVFISAHTFSTKATSDQDDDRDDHED